VRANGRTFGEPRVRCKVSDPWYSYRRTCRSVVQLSQNVRASGRTFVEPRVSTAIAEHSARCKASNPWHRSVVQLSQNFLPGARHQIRGTSCSLRFCTCQAQGTCSLRFCTYQAQGISQRATARQHRLAKNKTRSEAHLAARTVSTTTERIQAHCQQGRRERPRGLVFDDHRYLDGGSGVAAEYSEIPVEFKPNLHRMTDHKTS